MTAIDDRPVNGHKVNGHGHGHRWAPFQPIPELGPAEPLTQPLPAVTNTGEMAEPAPAPTPEPAAEPPADTPVDLDTEMRRDGYRPPDGPTDTHTLPVNFPLRHAIKAGFAMTVLAAAVGQTLFFAGFFGGGLLGMGLAILIAAFAEVTMIGSGDGALRHKVEGNAGWQLLLAVSALVAVGATVLQVAHWLAEQQPVMALTFGAASLLGWLVHIVSGLIAANGYLARRAEWDDELDRRRRKRESRADAEQERRLAEWETQQQAVRRAAEHVEPPPAEPSQPKPAKRGKAAGKAKPDTDRAPSPDRSEVLAWAAENNAGFKKAARHFRELGYHLPDGTARGWLAKQ